MTESEIHPGDQFICSDDRSRLKQTRTIEVLVVISEPPKEDYAIVLSNNERNCTKRKIKIKLRRLASKEYQKVLKAPDIGNVR